MIFALLLTLATITPEDCLRGDKVSVTYDGKTYRFAEEQCKEEFLSDPERYSQLYDALLELGKPKARPASLVPS